MEGFGPTTYGDAFADVYDQWYGDVSPADATASFLAQRLAGRGRSLVVELGSGTGRLAGPVAAAGHDVVGIDASAAMLDRSRQAWPQIPVATADMVEPPVRDGVAGCVLVAFNTLFNLPSRPLQQQALARAASMLAPDGFVVVEAFVPGSGADEASDHVDVVRLEADRVVLRVSRTDPAASTVSGHHIELRDGEPVRLRPWHLRFSSPEELDRIATAAGLTLVERHADWLDTPFDRSSAVHVSVYRADQHHR